MTIFEYVRAHLAIEMVVGSYVTLRPAGAYLKASCPFHSETDASFTVSLDKKIFYCFGCHAHGDVVAFVAQIENCSQMEAITKLIELYSIAIPENISRGAAESVESQAEKKSYFKLCQLTTEWCARMLAHHQGAREYIVRRGISPEMVTRFKIGFFPGGQVAMAQYVKMMAREGILVKDLLAAGMCVEHQRAVKSPFEDRIVFPIIDHYGRYCGFGGRVFVQNDSRPKYYNSKESSYFIKGQLLYNFDGAKKAMQEAGAAFLVEGYTDCVALVQAGYENVVATLGTACTQEHLARLARVVDTVYVMYDGDSAGQKAIMRLTELCWELSLELQVVMLPTGVDPAEYCATHENLNELLAHATDIFTFFVARECMGFAQKSLAAQCQSVDKLVDLIRRVPHLVKRDLLLQRMARSIGIPLEVLRAYCNGKEGVGVVPASGGESGSEGSSSHVRIGKSSGGATLEESARDRMRESLVAAAVQGRYSVPVEVRRLCAPFEQTILEAYETMCEHAPHAGWSCDECVDRRLREVLSSEEKANLDRYRVLPHGILGASDFQSLLTTFVQKKWKQVVGQLRQQVREAEARGAQAEVSELMHRFSSMKHRLETGGFLHDEKD